MLVLVLSAAVLVIDRFRAIPFDYDYDYEHEHEHEMTGLYPTLAGGRYHQR